jgi:anti-sigma regulatory factor (Ser/Thr protein kinase)
LRAFVRATAYGWGLPGDTTYALVTIASEPATNAHLHSGSPDVGLLLRNLADPVEITIAGHGRWQRRRRKRHARSATSGRGLKIVRTYAAGVRVHRGDEGTRVVVRVHK